MGIPPMLPPMAEDSSSGMLTAPDEPEDMIENPVTGERIKFLDGPTPVGGDVLRFEF